MIAVPCYGIIPARYESSRFPGKPLADLCGKPMCWHVYERARRCEALRRVVLATDDRRILSAATDLNIPCLMTRGDHASGTDRVYEAALFMEVEPEAVVINIQGDEPLLDPAMLDLLVSPFVDPDVLVSTLATPIDAVRAASPHQVKVVMDAQGNALYFSRALMPYPREGSASYWGHIGLYAFRMSALRRFVELAPSSLEQTERLEQLRLLEHGIPIRVLKTGQSTTGVDTPDDLERVRAILQGA